MCQILVRSKYFMDIVEFFYSTFITFCFADDIIYRKQKSNPICVVNWYSFLTLSNGVDPIIIQVCTQNDQLWSHYVRDTSI